MKREEWDQNRQGAGRWCVYPGCKNTRRTRGLCHAHYQSMRAMVRKGKATEADLTARGLLMKPGTGGMSSNGNAAFTLGSQARGDAR